MAQIKTLQEAQGQIQQLREWIDTQPQLPKDTEDRMLHRFLHSCYYDLEKTKTAFNLFFSLRASSPELLNNRDPQSDHIQKAFKITNLAQLQISGNRNLWIWQLNDPGLDRYDYVLDAKLFILATDAWLLSEDRLEEADFVIMDVKDISLKFITKFNVSAAKKVSKYQEEALPIRLKQVHVVNAPPFIDKVFGMMKPFLKQEICDLVHFHSPKSENLLKYFSKDELPTDYGGTRGSMQEHMSDVLKIIDNQREHFLHDNLWKAIDTKKSKNKTEKTDAGSFRSLDID